MDNLDNRLVRCFSSVFPDLTDEQIRNTNVESVGEWNSLTSVTLVALIQEEFGIQVSLDDLPNLTSFAAIQNYVHHHHVPS